MHNPVTKPIQHRTDFFHLIQMKQGYSPQNDPRPNRHTRKHLQHQRPALAQRIIAPRVRAPTPPPAHKTRQAARAVRDGEEGDGDVDEQVERQGGCQFTLGTEAAEVVRGEEEGEDCLYLCCV